MAIPCPVQWAVALQVFGVLLGQEPVPVPSGPDPSYAVFIEVLDMFGSPVEGGRVEVTMERLKQKGSGTFFVNEGTPIATSLAPGQYRFRYEGREDWSTGEVLVAVDGPQILVRLTSEPILTLHPRNQIIRAGLNFRIDPKLPCGIRAPFELRLMQLYGYEIHDKVSTRTGFVGFDDIAFGDYLVIAYSQRTIVGQKIVSFRGPVELSVDSTFCPNSQGAKVR